LDLVDQAVLEGEQAEQEVAVGGERGHGSGLPGVGLGPWTLGPRRRRPLAGPRPASVGLSHGGSPHASPPRPIRTPARPADLGSGIGGVGAEAPCGGTVKTVPGGRIDLHSVLWTFP
jgi:hypothetical protein